MDQGEGQNQSQVRVGELNIFCRMFKKGSGEDMVAVFVSVMVLKSLQEEMLRRGEVRGPAALLIWCQRVTRAYYPYVNITNMSRCSLKAFVLFHTNSFVKLLEEWACLLRTYPSLPTQPS